MLHKDLFVVALPLPAYNKNIKRRNEMRKAILILLVFVMAGGFWACQCSHKEAAISIGKLRITKQEVDTSLLRFAGERQLSPADKKKLINSFINRKLILLEAEREGLDKDPSFLQDVQFFWEQTLLKLIIDRKIKELSGRIKVTENEVRDYFENHKESFGKKSLEEIYGQIKFILFRQKQQKALTSWINSLRQNAKIKINYKLLGIQEGGSNG